MKIKGKILVALLAVIMVVGFMFTVSYAVDGVTSQDLSAYAAANGGSVVTKLTDKQGNEITDVDDLDPDGKYKVRVVIDLPRGIEPGSYTQTLVSEGFIYTVQSGNLSFVDNNGDKITLGTWSVSTDGIITYVFNDLSNDYQDVVSTAEFSIQVDKEAESQDWQDQDEDEIDIDDFKVMKSGEKTTVIINGESVDAVKWTVDINPECNDSIEIQRGTVTDTLTGPYFTDEFQALGITMNVVDSDGNVVHTAIVETNPENPSAYGNYFNCEDDTVWTFEMNPSLYCQLCTQSVAYEKGYDYQFVYYTAVPDSSLDNVTIGNTTTFTNDGYYSDEYKGKGSVAFKSKGSLVKNYASLKGDSEGELWSSWKVAATIPAYTSASGYYTAFTLRDTLTSYLNGNTADYKISDSITKDIAISSFKIAGSNVNEISSATSSDEYAYELITSYENGKYVQLIKLYNTCNCTEANCGCWENGSCGYLQSGTSLCACWHHNDEDVKVEYTYKTNSTAQMEEYGGTSYLNYNTIVLLAGEWERNTKIYNETSHYSSNARHGFNDMIDKVTVSEPGSDNDYIAEYKMTINTHHVNLGNDACNIADEMSDSLVYIPGTIKVVSTDLNGNEAELNYNEDFKLTVDEDSHSFTLTILKPGNKQYTISYEAQIVTSNETVNVDYKNKATLNANGKSYSDETEKKTLFKVSFNAIKYDVDVYKVAGDANGNSTNVALEGAEFGVYAADGELVTTGITDKNGLASFATNVPNGVIYKTHEAYYLKEIKAPEGFALDQSKHWFYFCNKGDSCVLDSTVSLPQNEKGQLNRIDYTVEASKLNNKITVTNQEDISTSIRIMKKDVKTTVKSDLKKYFGFTLKLQGLTADKVYKVDISNAGSTDNPTEIVADENGAVDIVFKLQKGEYIDIYGLDVGSTYVVEEKDLKEFEESVNFVIDGETVKSSDSNIYRGTIITGDNGVIEFINTKIKSNSPKTGDIYRDRLLFLLMIMIGSLISMVMLVVKRKRI